jgi:cGMP-dependent protein kinase 2
MTKDVYRIEIISSGPGGLSAAAHAAEMGVSHILIEGESHVSNTIFRYQKGKHVMDEPGILPLRSPLEFTASKREVVLGSWESGLENHGANLRLDAEVVGLTGEQGAFEIKLELGEIIKAETVVLGIGVPGNPRTLGVPGEDLPVVQYTLTIPKNTRMSTSSSSVVATPASRTPSRCASTTPFTSSIATPRVSCRVSSK